MGYKQANFKWSKANAMKCKILLLTSLIAFNSACYSQSHRSIRAKAGEDIAQAYSKNGFYRFPQFSQAKICSKPGCKDANLRFNYNLLSGKMQFIGPKGDTLDMASTVSIDSIVIDQSSFFYADNGFTEIVKRAGPVFLARRTVIKLQTENIGAYGQPNPTASIMKFNSYYSGTNVYNLVINEDVVIAETVYWLLLTEGQEPVKAGRANLQKILPPGQQGRVEEYLKKNKVNFEKEKDLLQLFAALAE